MKWDYDDKEKVKSDYEYKITLLQKRIGDLERENEDAMVCSQFNLNFLPVVGAYVSDKCRIEILILLVQEN